MRERITFDYCCNDVGNGGCALNLNQELVVVGFLIMEEDHE
jgi:hypothetical protein